MQRHEPSDSESNNHGAVGFTIITPNLNYGHFLGDCLQSVAAQEGVTFEHFQTWLQSICAR